MGNVADRTRDAVAELTRLGAGAVSTEAGLVLKVSSDWARMSPVLAEKVPPGRYLADAVVRPEVPEHVPEILRVAFEHDVPVTPRGAGTGNYGQATPFAGGILLDLRGLDSVAINDGTVTCGAGARLNVVDRELRASGRDIWMYPSTKTSTVGGFIGGGSAGTGTIEHGTTADGFVVSALVAPCDGSGTMRRVNGEELVPYVHTYGVTGILVDVEVRTDPAREWRAVYTAFDTYAELVAVHRALLDLPVRPRLASADEPALVPTLTASVPLEPDRHSLRVIAEASTVDALGTLVRDGGGDVVAVLEPYAETDRLSGMSYNHPVWFLQRAAPERNLFHLETQGLALWTDPDAVRAVYDGPVHLHLELFAEGPGAMVVAEYRGEEALLAGLPRFEEIGMGVHSPHQWYVDRNVALARETARHTDPKGLLNPGKLVEAPPVDTRVNIGGAVVRSRWMDLTMPDVAALPADTVAVLPLGSVEQHGPHLPVSTDHVAATAAAEAAVDAVAGSVPVVLLPGLAFTKSDEHARFPGTVWLSWDTLMRTLVDVGRSLHASGINRLLFVNGHGGNSALGQVACREIRKEFGLRTFFAHLSVPVDQGGTSSAAAEYGMGIHGGHGETSLMLYLRPDLVRMDLAVRRVPEQLREFNLIGFGKPVSFGWTSDDFGPDGHIGDPTGATAEHGKAVFEAAVGHLAAVIGEAHRFPDVSTAPAAR